MDQDQGGVLERRREPARVTELFQDLEFKCPSGLKMT
jgi:hypothetical protein